MEVSCITDEEAPITYHVPADAGIRARREIQYGLHVKVFCGLMIVRRSHFILNKYAGDNSRPICIVCLGRFIDELEGSQLTALPPP